MANLFTFAASHAATLTATALAAALATAAALVQWRVLLGQLDLFDHLRIIEYKRDRPHLHQ